MSSSPEAVSQQPLRGYAGLAMAIVSLAVIYFAGLKFMVSEWSQEEYSHGYLIPVIAAALLWRERKNLFAQGWNGAWLGFIAVVVSSIIFLMGELSALYVIIQYAFLLALFGLVFSMIGWRGMKYALAPLLYLAFMIPLPDFLYNNLSAKLQLISSELGVAVIRGFGVSVFLEGNVIDLGNYKLQVVEACSGLRYLFPLMSFGFLLAYLFRAPMWMRALVFLATIPITVLMNSFRIGVIGVLVDKWGEGQAEGFLHAFEGWIIFMACVAILLGIMKLLLVITRDKRGLRDSFAVDLGEPVARQTVLENTRFAIPFFASVAVLALTAITAPMIADREEIIPQRDRFTNFDLTINDWKGYTTPVEQSALNTLKLEDYLSAKFVNQQDNTTVDTWIAYYSTQRKGVSIHSPKSCLPGSGWKLEDFGPKQFDGVPGTDAPLMVNRAIMVSGKQQLLVYYWFKQRDRNLHSEYALKWYLFWDSMTRKRTDGALMRLIIQIPENGSLEEYEKILTDFLYESYPGFSEYVPD